MSRLPMNDTVIVKPGNNVYTVLVIVATVAVIVGLAMVWTQANNLFDGGLLGGK